MTYWEDTLSEILDENGVTASRQQVVAIAKALEGAREVEAECTGVVERTRLGTAKKSPEQLRIEWLEYIIARLGRRYGVTVDINAGELIYLTPVGSGHMGTRRERLA